MQLYSENPGWVQKESALVFLGFLIAMGSIFAAAFVNIFVGDAIFAFGVWVSVHYLRTAHKKTSAAFDSTLVKTANGAQWVPMFISFLFLFAIVAFINLAHIIK